MNRHFGVVDTAGKRAAVAENESYRRGIASGTLQQAPDVGAGVRDQESWDQELLDEVIDGFMEEIPGILARLQRARRTRDMRDLAVVAHHVRGPLGLLRTDTLSWLARELETSAQAADTKRAGVAAKILILELQNLLVFLEDSA